VSRDTGRLLLGGAGGTTLDSLGRPTSQTEAVSGVTHTWTYPVNATTGTQETLAYGGSPATSLALTRNGREMETARTATIATGVTVTLATSDTSTGRDVADRWKQRTITQSGRAAKTQNRAFDAAGRLTSQSGLGLTAAGSYSYDANSGSKTAASLPLALGGAIADTFSYYAGGRLAAATTNALDESFSFDEAGNLLTDAVTDVGTTSFAYDAANRLTSSAYQPDLEGAAAATTYYGWDAANAWRSCQGPNASPTQANEPIDFNYNAQGRMSSYANSDTSTSAGYTYDASGQRTKSVVTVGATTTTTTFAYDGLTLLKLSATQGSTTWRIDYLTDEEGAPYGGVYRSPSSSTSPTYFTAVTNDHGDVLELCDADGSAFAAYRYDAWGSPQGAGSYATGVWTQSTSLVTSTLAGQIASRQVLRYAGYAGDAESGLYYCSARYYDPATRQWTTGDPAKADGEESAYQYCGGEPTGSTDPSGSRRIHLVWKTGCNNTSYLHKVLRVDAAYAVKRGLVRSAWYTTHDWNFKKTYSGYANLNTKGIVGPSTLSTTFRWSTRIAGGKHPKYKHHRQSLSGDYGGSRWITSEDFGNLHFGYIGHALNRALSTLRSISLNDQRGLTEVGTRRQEAYDEAQIEWGYRLYRHWGKARRGDTYYSRY
jgi:RHS repeat-associated protein